MLTVLGSGALPGLDWRGRGARWKVFIYYDYASRALHALFS